MYTIYYSIEPIDVYTIYYSIEPIDMYTIYYSIEQIAPRGMAQSSGQNILDEACEDSNAPVGVGY